MPIARSHEGGHDVAGRPAAPPAREHTPAAAALALQRAAGNRAAAAVLAREPTLDALSPDRLTSPRFAGEPLLEACFEDRARMGEGTRDTAQFAPVSNVQQALVELGFDLGDGGPAGNGVDGDYGPRTAAAVRAFKAHEGLGSEEYGDVGPGTMHRLDELFPPPGDLPLCPDDDPILAGDTANAKTAPVGLKGAPLFCRPRPPRPLPVRLAHDVVLDTADGYADVWSKQFIAAQPMTRRRVEMHARTAVGVVAEIKRALALAAPGGRIIFNVGHGSAGAYPFEGTLDLAPAKALRLVGLRQPGGFTDVFYDTNTAGPPAHSQMEEDQTINSGKPGAVARLASFAIYRDLSRAFTAAKIDRVYFLTCRVGGALEFLRKIANDWGTVLVAYRDQMMLEEVKTRRIRIHLAHDDPGKGTNIPASEEQVPLDTESNSVRVGPPRP